MKIIEFIVVSYSSACSFPSRTVKRIMNLLKALFHSACLARVVSWFAFVVAILMGHEKAKNKCANVSQGKSSLGLLLLLLLLLLSQLRRWSEARPEAALPEEIVNCTTVLQFEKLYDIFHCERKYSF